MAKYLDLAALKKALSLLKGNIDTKVGTKMDKFSIGTGLELKNGTMNVTLDTSIAKIVTTLPASPAAADTNKIHFVPSGKSGTNDIYSEYIWLSNKWEKIGDFVPGVDLSPYLTKTDAQNTYAKKDGTGATGTWNISINGLAGTATKLATARTLTIGSTSKSFDGSSNVAWTLAEIGAAAASHSHNYLPLTGGTLTGLLTAKTNESHSGIKLGDTYLTAINDSVVFQNNSAIRFGGDSWSWDVWAGLKYDHPNKNIYLGLADGTIFEANTKPQSGGSILTPGISNIYVGNNTINKVWHAGNDGSGSGLDADLLDGVHSSKFPYINDNDLWRVYGNSSANALADNTAGLSSWAFGESRNTSRTYLGILKPNTITCGIEAHGTIVVFGKGDTHMGIAANYSYGNFQVFGGNSDKIVWRKTVAFTDSNVASATKLQTARTLTIGNTGKNFDGTSNVSWSLSEIGAAATNHTHSEYVKTSESLKLGETSSTAYAGDKGKAVTDLVDSIIDSSVHVGELSVRHGMKSDYNNCYIIHRFLYNNVNDGLHIGEDSLLLPLAYSDREPPFDKGSGLMSAEDKYKLDGIADNATADSAMTTAEIDAICV